MSKAQGSSKLLEYSIGDRPVNATGFEPTTQGAAFPAQRSAGTKAVLVQERRKDVARRAARSWGRAGGPGFEPRQPGFGRRSSGSAATSGAPLHPQRPSS